MRFGSYGALRQFPNTIWRNETSGRLRYGDEKGAVHLVTQVFTCCVFLPALPSRLP